LELVPDIPREGGRKGRREGGEGVLEEERDNGNVFSAKIFTSIHPSLPPPLLTQ